MHIFHNLKVIITNRIPWKIQNQFKLNYHNETEQKVVWQHKKGTDSNIKKELSLMNFSVLHIRKKLRFAISMTWKLRSIKLPQDKHNRMRDRKLEINKHRPDWFLVSIFINMFEENEKGMEKHVCAEFSNTSGLLCHMPLCQLNT